MSATLNSGDVIGLSEENYSAITFPTGTKVTFPVRIQPEVEGTSMMEFELRRKQKHQKIRFLKKQGFFCVCEKQTVKTSKMACILWV